LGIKTIGEFVSEKIIHDKVVELGIDYSQGYYFSKPIALNTLKKRENY
jgi:EAL domain-containing protein (putative c-di-GMP-specific phosphodiesterase class I)